MSTSEVSRSRAVSGVAGGRTASPQYNSASDLSSPPRSSPEPGSPSNQFHNESITSHHNSSITVNPPGVEFNAPVGKPDVPQPPARKKPGRKPKSALLNADSSATNTDAPKVKKPRKPRDPNAPPIQRRKKNAAPDAAPADERSASGSYKHQKIQGAEPNFIIRSDATLPSQSGKSEDIQRPTHSFFNSGPPPPPPQQYQQPPPPAPAPAPAPARTSGQNYDPIRSNYDPVRETVVSHNPFNNSQGSPSQPSMNRASASPSISSLVDPPNHALTSPSIAAQSFFNQQQARLHQNEAHNSVPPSPTANRLAASVIIEPTAPAPPPAAPQSLVNTGPKKNGQNGSSAMSKKNSMGHGSTATSSAAASPKPPKPKDMKDKELYPAPPPLPGSGLMGLGGGPGDGTEFRAPTVILNIPMNGEVNKIINFTRMAEERYGWDALHPRLAAQRDRLARVAAAGAALERNGSSRDSGDDMSLDSEAEGSNVEMGGMSDARTGTDGGAKKVVKKRRMKEDEYDKDDAFVDDSELLWEEHAAAATDGFFVYSGPLQPEGEKPALDLRADGAPKRGRGRGSRGGRGGTTRGGRAATLAVSESVGINARTGLPLSGPGSRGGSTTRKPRITKADRQRMEQEKLEREKMGTMASMPAGYSGMAQLGSSSNLGNTPMVFNQ
ncbi:hypothetical protein B0J14DRAFT_130047 [Halenospora varia]|nr:hypothetical protein B0J14DRAFT_130047 [Halenospora varia]